MAITFLSTRSRGFNYDLKVIEEDIQKSNNNIEFKYFTIKENSKNSYFNSSTKTERKLFVNDKDDIVCIDGSLPKDIEFDEDNITSRILIPLSYDYQFKSRPKEADVKKNDSFSNFTHIIPPSPLAYEYIKENCDINEGQKIITGYCSPTSYAISKNQYKEKVRERFCYYYPEAKNKKIVSIIRAGKYDVENPEKISEFDINAFIEALGDEFYVITNVYEILNSMARLPNSKKNSLCFIDKMIKNEDLLSITDVLISSNSLLLSAFAVTKKPFYVLDYKGKAVEGYFREHFPSLIFSGDIKTAEEIKQMCFTEDMEKACELLSYPADNNILELLKELLAV